MRIDRRNHPLLCTAVPWQFCCLLSLLSKCTTIQCYVCHGIAFAAPVRVVVSGLLIMVDCEGLRKFGSMEWWLKTKKWDCFLFRGISCRWYIVWGRCRSIFCVHDSKACHSIDVGTIERRFQNWQKAGVRVSDQLCHTWIHLFVLRDMWRLFDIAPFAYQSITFFSHFFLHFQSAAADSNDQLKSEHSPPPNHPGTTPWTGATNKRCWKEWRKTATNFGMPRKN